MRWRQAADSKRRKTGILKAYPCDSLSGHRFASFLTHTLTTAVYASHFTQAQDTTNHACNQRIYSQTLSHSLLFFSFVCHLASEPAVSRAQRDAHKRAVRLAKQQAKVYAKARRRERKASGLSPAASPSASPAGSPLVARRAVGSLDSYLNIMSDSLDTGHTSDDTASVIGGTPPPLRRGQLPPPVPTRIAPPRSPLRQLVAQDRAWSSLRHLPGELPPRPLPLAAVAAQLRQLSASQEVLALPPVRGGDDATSATLPSSRAPANASQSRGGSSTRLVSMDNAAATTPPALAFYALWDCPFVPEGQHAKRRAAAVTQMLAAYRRLQAATTKMLGKVDAILVKEYRASAASLEKQAAQSIKVSRLISPAIVYLTTAVQQTRKSGVE